ncbi:MAG: HEAT repeat domain-containing protein [Phycisphaerae bacterium]
MAVRAPGSIGWAAGLAWLALAGCSDPTVDLESGDSKETIAALRECADAASEKVAERVEEVVSHEDTMVAAEAVRTLGRMRHPRAVDALKKVAAGDKERRSALRQEAVIQLGRQRDAKEKVLPVLRDILQRDPDPRVRGAAAVSISKQKSLHDVALLMEVAENETDRVVQAQAVGAVERMVGLKFGYDPSAPKAERDAALERMRRFAIRAAAAVEQWDKQGNR